ncbi:hypothetical protein BHE74_00019449 [Ensete ventricosum]|nr:hypothetical protein BHE74_00019449 [Ensete ventricosum]
MEIRPSREKPLGFPTEKRVGGLQVDEEDIKEIDGARLCCSPEDLASGPPVAGVPGTCLWLLKDGMLLHLGESIVVVIDEGLGLSRGEEGREGVVPTATVKVARKELHLMPMPLLKLKAVAFSEKKCCTLL